MDRLWVNHSSLSSADSGVLPTYTYLNRSLNNGVGPVIDNLTSGMSEVFNFSTMNGSIIYLRPQWALIPVITLLTDFAAVLGNGVLLAGFFKTPTLLRNVSFNVLLANLLLANFFCFTLQLPFDIAGMINKARGGTGRRLDEATCTFYMCVVWILDDVICNAHLLIALNRIWAVIRPVSYRSHHSIRMAIFLCVGVWVYTGAFYLPFILMDAAYYRQPTAIYGCYMNLAAQATYSTVAEFANNIVPQLVMWVALPLIVCAKYQRNRQRANGAVAPINSNSTAARSHSRNVTVSSQAKPRLTRPFGLRSRATWLLVFLTLTITVTWTPANLYFLLVTYIPHFDQTHGPFYSLKTILFELQPVMDPIVFFLAMKPLRNAVGSLFAPTPRV